MTNGKFAQRLNRCMAEKGIRPADLARYVKTNRQTIYKYTKGISEPKDKVMLGKIARILGVTPAYLLGLEDDVKAPKEPIREEINELLDDMTQEELEKLLRFIKDYIK